MQTPNQQLTAAERALAKAKEALWFAEAALIRAKFAALLKTA